MPRVKSSSKGRGKAKPTRRKTRSGVGSKRSKKAKQPRSKARPSAPEIDRADAPANDEHTSVLALIRGVQSGSIAPQSLSVESRRACVEHLTSDGFSVSEIAQVLVTSDRTIARDRAAMRTAHCVEPSPELTRQMVGHMLREADVSVSRLRRFARGNDVEIALKIESEKASWAVLRDMIHMLQRLGYLPTAPSMIQGQLVHHNFDSGASLEDLGREIVRIEKICQDDPQIALDGHSMRMIKQVKSTTRTLTQGVRATEQSERAA